MSPVLRSERNRRIARETLAYLHDRYREHDSLTAIAKAAGVSTFHLCRVFRANTGKTISAHRRSLRLYEAARHLLDGESDVGAVAARVGFASASHFAASFRREFGTSPTRLANE